MGVRRREVLALPVAASLAGVGRALGQTAGGPAPATGGTIRIGVVNDRSGPYRDATGQGSVVCAELAAAEARAQGLAVEVIGADHQNKPDVGVAVVRQWLDRDGIDMVLDVPTSSVALAVAGIVREHNKVYVNTGAGTADLTGSQCTPNTVHWSYDTYMLARSTASQVTRLGGDKWFFVTADYVFGQQLARDAARFVKAAGGQVLGEVRYPFPGTTDFSSLLLQGQSAGATVIGLANAGSDTINCVKEAHEFGLKGRVAALLLQLTDVQAIGLDVAQGIYLTASFYWDLNDGTRALTRAVLPRMPEGAPPNMGQAACYAGTRHYLKAVAALGAEKAKADGAAVVARMKAMPTEDMAFGQNHIRADGLAMIPAYLFQVKAPGDSHGKWDLQRLVATTPADQAWKPLSEEGCAFIKA